MKKILPLLSLFLASCASYHTHHDDGVYEDEAYYTNDYDPYYGYGGQSAGYSGDGSGVYFNNYNYYPDRWGNNYSNVNYSPYRYPRIGFYYSDCFSWTWGCHGYGSYNSWSSWSPWFYGGIAYSSWHYDDYYWYNRWRDRTYHHRPGYGVRNSARREVSRLADRQRNSRYKNKGPRRQGVKPSQSNRNRVSRDRSRNNSRYNAPSRQPVRSRSTRTKQPISRQSQSDLSRRGDSQNTARGQVVSRQSGNRTQDSWVARDLNSRNRNTPSADHSMPRDSSHSTADRYQRGNRETTDLNAQNNSQWLRNRNNENQGNHSNSPTRSQERRSTTEQYSRPNRMNKPAQSNRSNNKPSPVKSQSKARAKSSKREKSPENRGKSSRNK